MSPWIWALVGVVQAFMWRVTFVAIYEYWNIARGTDEDTETLVAFGVSFCWPIYWPFRWVWKFGSNLGRKIAKRNL